MDEAATWSAAFGGDTSEAYESTLVRAVFTPFARDLLDMVELEPGEALLDVACGPGSVTVPAARRAGQSGRVTGADLSETMLAIAASKDPGPGAAPIDYVVGPAESLDLADDTFDVVTCQQGIQFFPDRPAALTEMRRVTRTDGRLAFAVWRPIEENRAFLALAEAVGEVLGTDVEQAYRNGPWGWTDAAEMVAVAEAAGYHDIASLTRTLDIVIEGGVGPMAATLGASPIGAIIAAGGPEMSEAVLESLGRTAAALLDGDTMRSTMSTTVIVGTA